MRHAAETLARETRALVAAKKEHRRAALVIITLAPESAPAAVPTGIAVLSAAAWLLHQD